MNVTFWRVNEIPRHSQSLLILMVDLVACHGGVHLEKRSAERHEAVALEGETSPLAIRSPRNKESF